MKKIKLILDSAADLPKDEVLKYDMEIVPFSVTFDGVNYLRENIDITLDDFYTKLKTNSIIPKTSLPSVTSYLEVFKKYLDMDMDILCLCISSLFSGSYQSAITAKNILLEDCPDAKIVVIDTLLCTIAQGNLGVFAWQLIQKNYELEKIEKILLENRKNAKFIFTLTSLEHLQKGGRIGKGTSIAGAILNICPIFVFEKGEIFPNAKVRGKKNAFKKIAEISKEVIGDKENF